MTKRIFFKIFLAALPVLLIGACYLYADPFMVLYHYSDLHNTNKTHLELNEDYVATEDLIQSYPQYKYDSYIFGSSRSRFYTTEEWQKHISSKATFQYGVAMENLYGIAAKIDMLHKKNIKIKNVLIVADAQLLSGVTNGKGHLFRKHPLVSGESNLDFQFACFMDFFDYEAISGYLKLAVHPPPPQEDPQLRAERIIEKNRDIYYGPRMNTFYQRNAALQYSKPVIGADQKKLLLQIKQVFDADSTDYRIVISPLYDQKKLAVTDMNTLYAIFGKDRIYDFSGINDITNNIYNYFEIEHYRPAIAYRIMDSVYARHN